MTLYRPAPAHYPLLAPAVCLCVECSRFVLALRCPAVDDNGHQCGSYVHAGRTHSLLVDTVFAIAAERIDTHARQVDAARFGPLPRWAPWALIQMRRTD